MSGPGEIKDYYEGFSEYLFRDRLYPNMRQRAAREFLGRRLRDGDRVCEIGCGIGVITEAVARRVGSGGRVLATDLSESNIAVARRTASRPNITYRAADVLRDELESGPFDVVLLCDVFEHIPIEAREALGRRIGGLLAENGRILLTIPSPDYQRYLKEHRPDKLQVVDNVVTVDDMRELAERTGTAVRSWTHVDAFGRNQYVHVELARGPLYPAGEVRAPWWRRLWWKGFLYSPWMNRLRIRRYRSGAP